LPGSTGTYFCHFKDSGFGYRPKVFATLSGAAGGRLRLGISNSANSPDQVFPQDLLLNTDYQVVIRYVISTRTGTLWVDPTSLSDTSVTAGDSGSLISVTSFALRQSSANDGMGDLEVDNVVVGTTFDDVLTPSQAPVITTQPVDQAGFAGGSATFSVQAGGTAPLSYQWLKDGLTVSGATNSSLTLPNLSASDEASYTVTISNAFGGVVSDAASLTLVTPSTTLTVFNYNVKGNNAPDWSTNAAQVQAIGRQVQYLDPDIITFQEIPVEFTYEMTNFVTAFRPGFHLADDSGSDGFIRSVILSRYPILRDQSWLDGINLNPFGFNGNFTRDLYEAEISVPGYPDPFHVFTVHLKAGQGTSDSARRAAEANAISNFFVTGFLTSNSHRAYILTGDMNEDIDNPPASNPQTIQTLVSAPTGLELTTPVNPFSGSRNTISIQGTLNRRYDYVLPCGLLSSNILSSQIFRTDLIPGPLPPLLSSDSVTASDHLPVVMEFSNPFITDFELLSISVSNGMVSLTWETTPGRLYDIEGASTPGVWQLQVTNISAMSTNVTYVLPATNTALYYRILQR
jgi:endonuclease/exonuclease/phosphatase family metal-dependent hydrolase